MAFSLYAWQLQIPSFYEDFTQIRLEPAFFQAAITNYHRLGGLNDKIYFSQFWSLGSLKSGVPACLGSGESPLPHQMAIFLPPYMAEQKEEKVEVLWCLFL